MSLTNIIDKELTVAAKVLEDFKNDPQSIAAIEQAVKIMVEAIKSGGKVISCGNGGSACDAMHFAEELTGRYRENRKPIPAISISDQGHITCTANDYGFEHVFSRYVQALGNPRDVLLAISTSGNSANVLKAAEQAQKASMKVIGLSGRTGGKLSDISDITIKVPYDGYADRIQEVHIKIIHIIILLLEKHLT
ncbi:D-sedoheptulose 7-phosphate isomerase [Cytophagaceae bacterium ABcell3]|nr:D-sedoheptulose 7-phosphate isomerase [Cytophagaceae bacterium ABcell3]